MRSKNNEFGAGIIDDVLMVMAAAAPLGATETMSDTLGLKAAAQRSVVPDPLLVSGTVQLVVPYLRYAKFQADHGRGGFRCSLSDSNKVPNHGEAFVASVQLDTQVGTLLHTAPVPRIFSDEAWPDYVVHGSGVGFYGQAVYTRLISETLDRGGAVDFCNGQPLDQLPGDWGHIQETGVGFHCDKLMFFARVNETTGVFGYYMDNTLRVAGDNLEIESDACTTIYGNDEGEIFHEAYGYYTPWEILGKAAPTGSPAFTVNDPAQVVRQGGNVWEMQDSNALPFARFLAYGGYLGQGHQTICCAMGSDTHSEESQNAVAGLSRIYQAVGGQILIESAKRITIAKSAPFYVPIRKLDPRSTSEDADSLANANYKFSGHYGDGDEHVMSDLVAEGTDQLARMTGQLLFAEDLYAFDSAWAADHVAAAHTNDFMVSDTVAFADSVSLDISSLDSGDHINPPSPETIQVDHRYQERLYQLLSLIQLGDDGSITIQEALGASITLSGGVVTLSGTAVRINGGKTVHLAGGRLVMRSATDMDFVSNRRLRMSADRDMMLLSGASGAGGMLLENRSSGNVQKFPAEPNDINSSGIILKSAKSPIQTLSAGFYLRSGVKNSGVQGGDVIIDVDNNYGLYQRAASHYRYTSQQYFDIYGLTTSNIRGGNLYSALYNRFTGSIGTLGQVIVGGGVQAIDNIITNAEFGKSSQPEKIIENVAKLRQDISDSAKLSATRMQSVMSTYYESAGKIGNPVTAAEVSFGFPSSVAYGASGVKFHQPHWQSIIQLSSSSRLQAWNENNIIYQPDALARRTRAWPGDEVWSDATRWLSRSGDTEWLNRGTNQPLHPVTDKDKALAILAAGGNLQVLSGSIQDNFKFIQ